MSLKKVNHVVLVLSGKGGVGKSSVTTQLALSLSLKGHSVGILDVDLTGPSIPRLLGIENAKVKQAPGGWIPVQVHESQTLEPAPAVTYPTPQPSVNTNGTSNGSAANGSDVVSLGPSDSLLVGPTKVGPLYAMSLAFLLASRGNAIVWRGPKKTAMIRQFLDTVLWPQLDFLLIDTPPGTSDEHISLVETLLKDIGAPTTISTASPTDARDATTTTSAAEGADAMAGPSLAGAVIVTTPQAIAVNDVRKELNFCQKTGVKVIGVVENMSGYVCPCCGEATNLFSKGGGQVMALEFNIPFLGTVPIDPLWGLLAEQGKRPVYDDVIAAQLSKSQDDDDDDDDEEMTEQHNSERVLEPGSLVDKYRNCSLYPEFANVAQEVLQRAENRTAVAVTRV